MRVRARGERTRGSPFAQDGAVTRYGSAGSHPLISLQAVGRWVWSAAGLCCIERHPSSAKSSIRAELPCCGDSRRPSDRQRTPLISLLNRTELNVDATLGIR